MSTPSSDSTPNKLRKNAGGAERPIHKNIESESSSRKAPSHASRSIDRLITGGSTMRLAPAVGLASCASTGSAGGRPASAGNSCSANSRG